MKPQPLRARILSALKLAPMSETELARCLDARVHYVQRLVAEMRGHGLVRNAGYVKNGKRRPLLRVELAA